MSGDSDKGFLVNPFPVLMVVLLAAGVFVSHQELRSGRPGDPERAKFVPTTDQDVEARLWQDPLAAVEAAQKARAARQPAAAIEEDAGGDHRPDSIRSRINGLLQGNNRRVTVLAVSVFGGSYKQAAEARRRWRFAVVSALGFQQYQSERPDAIGYVSVALMKADTTSGSANQAPSMSQSCQKPVYLAKTNTTGNGTNDCLTLTVPYEWFRLDPPKNAGTAPTEAQKPDNVLVLWLNEDIIADAPQYYLVELFRELASSNDCGDGACSKGNGLQFKLIGPAASDTFAHLIRDRAKSPSGSNTQDSRALFDVFSPSATMSPDDLRDLIDLKQSTSPEALAGLSIVRATDTDDHLAKALIDELQLRGVAKRCDEGIILVRESDTPYSAKLAAHLKRQFCPSAAKNGKPFREFTYLRGIDGALPDLDKQDNAAPRKDNTDKSKDLRAQLENVRPEYAEGRNQFDYLRRLADQIVQLDHDPNFAEKGVKAIGIVGSDVYDKLLILAALRPQLTDKIFFTTDLDARYLHADQKEATRNLIVASNFDLALHPKLQGSTLPFRDTYQTATYLATLMALDMQCPRFWTDKIADWVKPQLFEIGRTQAVPLKPLNNNEDCRSAPFPSGDTEISSWTTCQRIEPIRPSSLPSLDPKTGLLIAIIVAIGVFLVAVTIPSVRFWVSVLVNNRKVWICVFATILLTCGGAYVVYRLIDNSLEQGFGEPFFWLEGVSVWPSVVLRFAGVAITSSLALFFKLKNDMQADEIAACFGLRMPTRWKLDRNWWQALRLGPHLDLASFHAYAKKISSPSASISTLWQYYISSTGWLAAIWWVVVSVVLMLFIGIATMLAFGRPSFPGRGNLVWWCNFISIFLAVLVVWFTVFWVIYETRACTAFINILSDMEEVQSGWAERCKEVDASVPPGTYRDAFLAFRLIVRTTQRVQRLIYLPFLSILFMVVARSNLFDALNFPLSLIVLNAIALAYALSSAIQLRRGAKAAKANIIDQIENLRFGPQRPSMMKPGPSQTPPLLTRDQIEFGLQRIRETREGAFAPLSEQPALQAFLLPFGGYGGLQLIESLVFNLKT